MREHQAAIWFISEHHLAYQAAGDWERTFLSTRMMGTRWKVHLNPAKQATRYAGCALIIDTKTISVTDAAGPKIVQPGHISTLLLRNSALITPHSPQDLLLVVVYLPYQEEDRRKQLEILRSLLHSSPYLLMIGGDFNMPRVHMLKTLRNWGFSIMGSPPSDHRIDYAIVCYRTYSLPHRPQAQFHEGYLTNWEGSDHPQAFTLFLPHSFPRLAPVKRTNWSLLKYPPIIEELQNLVGRGIGEPDPVNWPTQKHILKQLVDNTLATHRDRQYRREHNTQRAMKVVQQKIHDAGDKYLRAHLTKRLRVLTARLVHLRTPITQVHTLPDQRAFERYTSRVPEVHRGANRKNWYTYISPEAMVDTWKEAFYTEQAQREHPPFIYHNAPDIPGALAQVDLLKSLSRGRTPGPDGINSDVYKALANILGPHLTMYWRALLNGHMPPNHHPLQSNITMIHKKGDPSDPSNYRPISLLNTDLKILTSHLQKNTQINYTRWFGREQQGFLPNRWIHWNTRFLLDLLSNVRHPRFRSYSNINKSGLVLLKLDFRKAFDSVRWDFLHSTLLELDPPSPELQAIVDSIYKEHSATIQGPQGAPPVTIPINNGVKQGDCASPILFNLALEVFLRQLRVSTVQGLRLRRSHSDVKAVAYADDTLLICTLRSLPDMLRQLQNWSQISGVQVNHNKSRALLFPPARQSQDRLRSAQDTLEALEIPTSLWSMKEDVDFGMYLGIPINTNPSRTRAELEDKLLKQLTQAIKQTKQAAPFQQSDVRLRSKLATAMISSIPIYYIAAVPFTKAFCDKWKSLVTEFIFGKRHFRPSNAAATLAVGYGGIKMWHPEQIQTAMMLYAMHKYHGPQPIPEWAFSQTRWMIRSDYDPPLWWRKAVQYAATVGIIPHGTKFSYHAFHTLITNLQKETHDTLYDKIDLWWISTHSKRPPLLSYFPCRPISLREWWRTPLPARIKDWGWLTMWAKNHGGANSLRFPKQCRACRKYTNDWWHWGKTCMVQTGLIQLISKFPGCEHWAGLSTLYLWGNALGKLGSIQSVDIKHVVRVSWLAYLSWWTFHFISEAPPGQARIKAMLIQDKAPRLVKRIYDGHFQYVIDWLQEQNPGLYGQGTL